MSHDSAKIAVFASFSGEGGVEKMLANLCRGMVEHGYQVDLLLVRAESDHLKRVPACVRVVKLGTRHTFSSVFALAGYLKREQPRALLAAKDRAAQVAVVSRWLSGVHCRLVFRIGTTVSAALQGRSAVRRWAWYLPMRCMYQFADTIVGVSQGVTDDIKAITGLPDEKFCVIDNPVITPELEQLSREPVGHPWLGEGQPPVIAAMGRLTRQKDFPTLLRAFARLKEPDGCRLLILGEGRDRKALLTLADILGIRDRVDLAGFQPNPYAYIRQASLFVLSSAWEGSPNVLTEAMALGIPVVATDCPSGPREMLDGGRIAPLVPVGDDVQLASAMQRVLCDPPRPTRLQEAVSTYTMQSSSRRYLDVLLDRAVPWRI
jgi:glycosyltransferase involved in cell wall biosynthesis